MKTFPPVWTPALKQAIVEAAPPQYFVPINMGERYLIAEVFHQLDRKDPKDELEGLGWGASLMVTPGTLARIVEQLVQRGNCWGFLEGMLAGLRIKIAT